MHFEGYWERVGEPAEEPLDLADAKLHLRVDHTDEDDYITSLIAAARQYLEEQTWRALTTQTWRLWLSRWPSGRSILLPRPPLQSIVSVRYYDSDDTEYTFGTSDYAAAVRMTPGALVLTGASWPRVITLRGAEGVVVEYVAGYGDADAVPSLLKHAVRMLVGHWYENRETVVIGAGLTARPVPVAVPSIIEMFQVR